SGAETRAPAISPSRARPCTLRKMLSEGYPDPAERVGSVLNDKYTLERLLGVGATASVYAAQHRNRSRVAVKILHPFVAVDSQLRARFLREGYLANSVDHPGIVRVIDDDVIDGDIPFLVME